MTRHIVQCVKTSLFLGAGASTFAGMPTTTELVDGSRHGVLHQVIQEMKLVGDDSEQIQLYSLIKNLVKKHGKKEKENDVEYLYQKIRKMKEAEKLHKELMEYKIFGDSPSPARKREVRTTWISSRRENIKGEAKDIDENISILEQLEVEIRNTVFTLLRVEDDKTKAIIEQYDKILQDIPQPWNIATTNYDNILESYCAQKELKLVNGFKPSPLGDKRIWGKDNWDVEGDSICLVKLHGSITWKRDGDDILEIGGLGSWNVNDDIMITPTLPEDKDYDQSIFPDLFKKFKEMLDKTELLVVVGFSFRDTRITQMIRDQLERTSENLTPMKLLYIDINPDGLKELFGADVEPRKVQVRGGLYHHYSDKISCVYTYKTKFSEMNLEPMLNIIESQPDCD